MARLVEQVGALMILSAAIACTTKTAVYESQFNKAFTNGQTIFVKRTDEVSRSYGAVTGHLYGQSHSFSYHFTLDPDDIVWTGLTRETPKDVLFCGDDLYVKTNLQQVNVDSVTQATTVVVTSGYYKNIDKRYFFKLFGDQYFVTVDSAEYQSKKSNGQEEHVPSL